MQFMCIHLSITIIAGSQLHFPANNNTALACVASKLHRGGGVALSALRTYVMDLNCVSRRSDFS